jgi:hypothetical protein
MDIKSNQHLNTGTKLNNNYEQKHYYLRHSDYDNPVNNNYGLAK